MKSIYEFIPKEIKEQGYTKEIIEKIYKQLYIKNYVENRIEKVEGEPIQIVTLEGLVMAMPGMYIVTGTKGEKYLIDQEILDTTYDKVLNKENMYTKKKYPVIAEEKEDEFLVPCVYANGGVLKGKRGDFLIQAMINSKSIYPIDKQIFLETYTPYTDYLREKYGVVDEIFEEEMLDMVPERKNIFQKIIEFFKNLFKKDDNLI